uniref:Uncharacterized protein n=1 Tax=Rhizophora mucronata TaxID=61149 RepID=A0A2P2MPL7_RHIMU
MPGTLHFSFMWRNIWCYLLGDQHLNIASWSWELQIVIRMQTTQSRLTEVKIETIQEEWIL